MSDYEIAFPPGAKNFENAEETFVRTSKDGDIPIFALFGGCEFVGEVLEGKFQKGNDGSIQGPFTAKINNGYLELTGRTQTAGDADFGWVVSKSPILFVEGVSIDIHVKMPSLAASNDFRWNIVFGESTESYGNRGTPENAFSLSLKATTTAYKISVWRRVGGSWTNLLSDTSVSSSEGTWRVVWNGWDSVKVYFHEGTGDVTDSDLRGTFDLSDYLSFTKAYLWYELESLEATNRTVSSDFVRVTYPNFSVKYDLDEDVYQGQVLETVLDSSGNGNHGTVYGTTWIESGYSGKALYFDGEDDKIVIPANSTLDITDEIAIEFAIKLTESMPSGWHAILAKGDSSYRVQFNGSNLYFSLNWAGGGYVDWDTGIDDSDLMNSWHVVKVTFDGTYLRSYLDGQLISTSSSYAGNTIQTNSYDLWIGNNSGVTDRWTEMYLDEVKLYSKADLSVQVGEWTFNGGSNRGEVIVWDTMGSSDESDWQRVLSLSLIHI